MTKRTNPITSILAHESVKESKEAMYVKIIAGMNKLKVGGTFEAIALQCKLKPDQVWKRLSELVEKGVVFNVGITHKTSSGRSAMVRQLVNLSHIPSLPDNKQDKQSAIKTSLVQKTALKQAPLEFNTSTGSWDDAIN